MLKVTQLISVNGIIQTQTVLLLGHTFDHYTIQLLKKQASKSDLDLRPKT